MANVSYGREINGKHVLDGEELNIGSTQLVPVPLPRPFAKTAVAPGQLIRLIDLKSNSSTVGQVVTIVMAQSIQESEARQFQNTSGPITGIVEFASGASGLIRVEFDIPSISRIGTPNGIEETDSLSFPALFKSPSISGVSFSVPGSSFRVYARNDNNYPLIGDPTIIVGSNGVNDSDPTVSAFASHGQIFGANRYLRKTVYVSQKDDATSHLVPGGNLTVGIPPFAKQVRFPRRPIESTQLDIRFDSYFGSDSAEYSIPVQSDGPLDIPPDAYRIVITNSTAAVTVTTLSAIFDLVI